MLKNMSKFWWNLQDSLPSDLTSMLWILKNMCKFKVLKIRKNNLEIFTDNCVELEHVANRSFIMEYTSVNGPRKVLLKRTISKAPIVIERNCRRLPRCTPHLCKSDRFLLCRVTRNKRSSCVHTECHVGQTRVRALRAPRPHLRLRNYQYHRISFVESDVTLSRTIAWYFTIVLST